MITVADRFVLNNYLCYAILEFSLWSLKIVHSSPKQISAITLQHHFSYALYVAFYDMLSFLYVKHYSYSGYS